MKKEDISRAVSMLDDDLIAEAVSYKPKKFIVLTKVATLVRSYIQEGGHQLQINSVNNEKMRKAQENPEEYKDLIVRVWGWSGHFVEMDKCYQDQIILRHEFGV